MKAFKTISSPVGKLTLVASDKGLTAILWEKDKRQTAEENMLSAIENKNHPVLLETERQLKEYFLGNLSEFSIPLAHIEHLTFAFF
jgi:methylated-DNA-[protein]-cysteine S-methyltransferase